MCVCVCVVRAAALAMPRGAKDHGKGPALKVGCAKGTNTVPNTSFRHVGPARLWYKSRYFNSLTYLSDCSTNRPSRRHFPAMNVLPPMQLPSLQMDANAPVGLPSFEKEQQNTSCLLWGKRPLEAPPLEATYCIRCEYTLASSEDLQKHNQAHEEKRNFLCTLCTRMFSQKVNRDKHVKDFHEKTEVYECPTCGKHISSKENLKKHKDLTHAPIGTKGAEVKCQFCPKVMRGDIARHQTSKACHSKRRVEDQGKGPALKNPKR